MASEKNPGAKQRLLGKVAIVTGAGRGIGRAEAMLLAREGAKVVVNDTGGSTQGEGLDESVTSQVVKEIKAGGGEAVVNNDSVASMDGGARIVKTALDTFGRLDILINNAGNARPRVIYNLSEEDWDAVIAVHLKGTFAVTRAAAPIFREQRSGVIVNTGSESGLGHLGQSNYSAAKEGIIGFTRTVARDLGRFNVRCNAIRPRSASRLATEETMQAMLKTQEMLGGPVLGHSMIDRSFMDNKPEQVAAVAVWLCTDAAANVNGRDFLVGGDVVGLFSEPEVVRALCRDGGWDLDSLDKMGPKELTAGLRNDFMGAGKS